MIQNILFLTTPELTNTITNITSRYTNNFKSFQFCYTLKDLNGFLNIPSDTCSLLFSFGTSCIVPADILHKFKYAINLHSASPEYPGRDPHHFALYNEASVYGATLHIMTETVDAGSILDVELFDIEPGINAANLLRKANASALILLERFFARHLHDINNIYNAPSVYSWSSNRTTRKQFNEYCSISSDINPKEFNRKFNAFQNGIKHKNLYIDLFGHRFIYHKKLSD